jgi:hypothetical protein
VPTLRAEGRVKTAVPLLSMVALPRDWPPALKVTVPLGWAVV